MEGDQSMAGLFIAGVLWALAQDAGPPAAPDAEPKPYLGVVPGPEARNPLPMPKREPPRLVWTGFKMAGERSQIFLQTTRQVAYQVQGGTAAKAGPPGVLSVFLRNCRIHLRNNGRRLDTRFFATPVAEVSARQVRKDVELRIVLKEPAMPAPRVEAGPGGTEFLVLEFPAGRAEPSAPEPATAAASADLAESAAR